MKNIFVILIFCSFVSGCSFVAGVKTEKPEPVLEPTIAAFEAVDDEPRRLAPRPTNLAAELTSPEMWGQGQAASDSACVRLNNYWCIKTPYDAYWDGQVGRDERDHARFSHPAFAARAFARIMRAYHFKHGLTTPNQIISRYAPSHDCKGFANPTYCPEKVSSYANTVAEAMGVLPNQSLNLFNSDGTLKTDVALPLFKVFAKVEIGGKFQAPDALILKGIDLERTAYVEEHGSLLSGPMSATSRPIANVAGDPLIKPNAPLIPRNMPSLDPFFNGRTVSF